MPPNFISTKSGTVKVYGIHKPYEYVSNGSIVSTKTKGIIIGVKNTKGIRKIAKY